MPPTKTLVAYASFMLAGCGPVGAPERANVPMSSEGPTPMLAASTTPSIASSVVHPSPAPAPDSVDTEDLVVGTGAVAETGHRARMYYVGKLTDGTEFDRTLRRPFEFTLGIGEVIAGWDRGIVGMRVGGKRRLVIPPELGYGARGAPPAIPPNATLIFEVELLEVQ